MLFNLALAIECVCGQTTPTITYAVPQLFPTGNTITLTPTITGGPLSPGIYSPVSTFALQNTPFSIAADKSNNIYTTDNTTGDLVKLNAAGDLLFKVNVGVSQASGVAVDNLGNVYVSQFTLNEVLKYNASGKLIATITGFDDPYGIAFDASNNAYIANWLSGNILKIAVNDTIAKPYLSGFKAPYGLVIDAGGNMYVGEQGVGDVIKIANGTLTKSVFASGFNGPRHLSKDAADNIYVADYGNNAVKRISAAGVVTNLLASGLSSPRQAGFDASGNLFVADYGSNTLKKSLSTTFSINAPLPEGLIFNTANGQITGTPVKPSPLTVYTITASYAGGTISTTLSIKVGSNTPNTPNTPQTINFPSLAAVIYGSPDFDPGASASSGEPVTYKTDNNSVAVISNGKIHIVGAGSVNVTASQPGDSIYNAAESVTQNLMVNKAPLTIAANNINTPFGIAIPVMTVSYSGFVNGDNASNLAVRPLASTTAVLGSATGSYPISVSGAISSNYNFIYQPGTLNIGIGTSSVAFTAIPAKTYGDSDFNLSAAASNNQAVTFTSDNPAVATVLNGKVHITGAGNANITASQPGVASGSAVQPLVINKANVTVRADNQSKTYGSADVVLSYNIVAGTLFNGDDLSGSLSRSPGEQAGVYNINKGSLTLGNNYILNYIAANLTIVPAQLSITADNKWITAGEALPEFTFTYSGFVNNDDAAKLTATPAAITSAVKESPAGTYTITPSGAASNNYLITYTPGTLVINAAVTVTQPEADQVIVHQALSPNGDGINDFLMIQGIENYPENKVAIISLNGNKIFETKNYDNSNKVFDGHSNLNGAFQQPGTYYYKVDYNKNNQNKSQTGFIVIKY